MIVVIPALFWQKSIKRPFAHLIHTYLLGGSRVDSTAFHSRAKGT